LKGLAFGIGSVWLSSLYKLAALGHEKLAGVQHGWLIQFTLIFLQCSIRALIRWWVALRPNALHHFGPIYTEALIP